MPLPTENRGDWVVGLQPDDRMPGDWLRMVARVFAAYRSKPLEQSIVVYIDGLNLTLNSHVNNVADVGISAGQAFVDDQFIGFICNSTFQFDTSWLMPDVVYEIVLQYRFINQFPNPEPHFLIVQHDNVNSEEMLILGHAVKDANGNLVITDDKVPWWREMIQAATGDAEVDAPGLLPYIISIKSATDANFPDDPLHPENEQGSLDLGWAIDFHNVVGNNVNYNTRLSTNKVDDGKLFINGREIFTTVGAGEANDPSDPGDVYLRMPNNLAVIDSFNANNPTANAQSDSGKACVSIITENTDLSNTEVIKGASWCFDYATESSSIQNRTNFSDQLSAINTLTLTNQTDVVTINGNPIWHEGNLASTGLNIMFVGYHAAPPPTRPNGDPVLDGDMYYDTTQHSYWYYQNTQWVEVGRKDAMKQYEITPTTDINPGEGISLEYNPQFIWIGIDGINLNKEDYIAIDGNTITFNQLVKREAVISVYTVLSGQAYGVRVQDLSDIGIVNINDGDTIQWDATLNQWVNAAPGAGGGMPVGGIIMWAGNITTIPNGWALCDGNNGTPNLVDKFIMGSDGTNAGATGGTSLATMPQHNHHIGHQHGDITTTTNGAHGHDLSIAPDGATGTATNTANSLLGTTVDNTSIHSAGDHSHTVSFTYEDFTSSTEGSSDPEANLPPYYKLAYIVKL
jgi:microcystin-dependent protein